MNFISRNQPQNELYFLMAREPDGIAEIRGSRDYDEIQGTALFYQADDGAIVVTKVQGLPETASGIFAMHIHSGPSCTGTAEKPFADAGSHYNPDNLPHPEHRGDLPPLFSNRGNAWSAVYTDRFQVSEVIGKAVILHLGADDFKTQPSGNAGDMIACGIIER